MTNEGRISRGWRLTRVSWNVLLSDSTALVLTLLQMVATGGVLVALYLISGWADHPHQEGRALLAAAVAYLPSTLLSTIFGVALCAAVAARLGGSRLSLTQALAVPMRRFVDVLLWSLLATGVGLLLEQIAARLPFGGRILTWLAGVAWSLGTLFVIPILALTDDDAASAVRRSADLVKRTWGEGISGGVVIGAWTIVLMIPLSIVLVIAESGSHRGDTTPWLIWAVLIVAVSSVVWAATRVFSVALYNYATGSDVHGPFADEDLERPFRRRKNR